jgi:Ca2+-binding RTX toxin-like protein
LRVRSIDRHLLNLFEDCDVAVLFSDSFEAGNFNKWSYVHAQDTRQGGPGSSTNFVATGKSLGISAHGGDDVAQFARPTSASSLPHAKIFKEWSGVGKRDQFGRVEDNLPGGDPSGTYKAHFFLPSNYKYETREWSNIFQFKEEGIENGKWTQNPSWWLNMSAASSWGAGGSEPVLFTNHWQNSWGYKPEVVKAPLGRWFEVRAEVRDNNRIDWFVDGKKLSTSYDSDHPVGRSYDKSDGWIFGVGHYGGYGKLYVDDVSVSTFGSSAASATLGSTSTSGSSPDPSSGSTATSASTHAVIGTGASETLKGEAANERFVGNGGDDTMVGGKGHDTYVVDSVGDKVIELAGEGTDQVLVRTWAHNMQANVENLVIERASGASVYGNALDNKIIGSAANDTIRGGQGADMMTGGGGDDVFVFRKGEAAGDVITDFRGNGTGAGDVLRFEGFGTGAKLAHVAEDWTVQYNGGSETFKLVGVTGLASGDVLFV